MSALYTYQIGHQRKLHLPHITFVDTTVKSGVQALAPRWDMVMGHKKGHVSDAAYTTQYRAILEFQWFHDPDLFHELLCIEHLALGCYCAPGRFCHRHLLVDFLCQASDHHVYHGELRAP